MTQIDQGLLSVLNSAVPNCEVNNEYATWVTSSARAKSVVKGTPCPNGYTKLRDREPEFNGNSQYDLCGSNSINSSPPVDLTRRLESCIKNRSPSPSPAPAPADSGLPAWAIALIVILIIFLLGGVGFMMTRT